MYRSMYAIYVFCNLYVDAVGMITKVSDIIPPSGTSKSEKRHIYFSDGRLVIGLYYGSHCYI
jgi:hypothetical protein